MKLLIRMTNAIFNIDKKTKYSCSKIKFSILKIKLTEVKIIFLLTKLSFDFL
jgi:hypothetical protein